MSFSVILINLIFLGCPIAAIMFFIVSLIRFVDKLILNKRFPNCIPEDEIKHRRKLFIISSIIMAVLVAIVVGFVIMLAAAVAYM